MKNIKIISLYEANSGSISEKAFKTVLSGIMNSIIDGLKKLDGDSYLSTTVEKKRTFSYQILYHSRPTEILPPFPTGYVIKVKLKGIYDKRNSTYFGAFVDIEDDESIINVDVKADELISTILQKIDELEPILAHELVHIFKKLRGEHQKTGEQFTNKATKRLKRKKYFSSSSEIDAFIAQMNVEMKHVHSKDDTISFSDAIRKNRIFLAYIRELNDAFNIGNYNPLYIKETDPTKKLKKYVLKKLAHYWKEELKGK